MEYTLTIRQLAIYQNFPSLDIKDAAILDYMSRFACSPSIKKKIHAGQVYYWFAYQKIAEENPLVGLSPESLRKRLREFCRLDILQSHPDNQGGAVFFAFGSRYELTHRAILPDVQKDNIGQNRPKGRAKSPEVQPKVRANSPDNQIYQSNQNNQNKDTNAKNEFSPDTADDAPEYRIEVFEPMRVETVRLGAGKGETSNGARRDVLQPGGNASDQLAPNWNTPEKARAMSARLGDEFAEMLEKEYGVKVVTVSSDEPIPETLGKPKKMRRTDEPQPFPETAGAFAHFSNPDKIAALWKRWLAYKKDQHRERYKTADSELTKLRWLWKQTNGDTDKAEQIIERSIGDLYKGLLPLTENKNGKPATTSNRETVRHQLVEIYANKRRAAENQRGTLGATETGWQL